VLVTVKLEIAAALAESALKRAIGKAAPIARNDANRSEKVRVRN
jgi:hypothetical protein